MHIAPEEQNLTRFLVFQEVSVVPLALVVEVVRYAPLRLLD